MANVEFSADIISLRKTLLKLSKPQLIKLCKKKNVSHQGNKKDIINRLLNAAKPTKSKKKVTNIKDTKNKKKSVKKNQKQPKQSNTTKKTAINTKCIKNKKKSIKKIKASQQKSDSKTLTQSHTSPVTTPVNIKKETKVSKQNITKVQNHMTMTSTEHIRAEVLGLIEKHEPDKTNSINVLMKKWKRKENDLLKAVCEKYKEKYTRMQPMKLKDYYSIGPKIITPTYDYEVLRKCKRRQDGGMVTIKIINKKKIDKESLQLIDNEINILRELSHPNICNLYDIYEGRKYICLVLDCCDGGELFELVMQRGHLSEKDAKKTFVEACTALQYMHSKYIVHRDIRPETILFENKKWNSPIKLTYFDFVGCCKHKLLTQPMGSPMYVAPEILRRIPYDTQVDMWSIGVMLYMILCGFPPFYVENDDEKNSRLYSKIKNVEYDMASPYWDNISTLAKDLVRKLLEPDPNKRLTAKSALTHRWIMDRKLDMLIKGYIQREKKYDVLLTFSAKIIRDFAFLLFVGYFCDSK